MTPPVLVIAYRRPGLVRQVLEAVAAARPQQLFLACDGPKRDRPGEDELVRRTREAMDLGVVWDCRVERRYVDSNQGCRVGVQSAVDWFFEHVDEGIILEDDCIPHPDFFPYCAELLARYREDRRVMHISGDGSLGYPSFEGDASYAFTRAALVWGWASWRRAWEQYDRDLVRWLSMRSDPAAWRRVFPDRHAGAWWAALLEDLRLRGAPDSWAYRWYFSLLERGGTAIVPRVNLIQNIGHGPDSTHTFDAASPRAAVPVAGILPIRHPADLAVDAAVDARFQRMLHGYGRSGPRVRRTLKRLRRFRRRVIGTWGAVRRRLGYRSRRR